MNQTFTVTELGTNPVCEVQPSSVQNPTSHSQISSHLLPPIPRSTKKSLLSTFTSGNISQLKTLAPGTSLVVQWLRLHALNMQVAWVQSLIRELDPTCCN